MLYYFDLDNDGSYYAYKITSLLQNKYLLI